MLRAVAEAGYTTPTPIQAQAIPVVLAGKDVMGGAQTGTGKTAGFALPILQKLPPHRQHEPLAGAASGARADPHPDARARGPGRGIDPDLRQVHGPALDRRVRRRRHQAAAGDRPRRRRDPRRHAGPAARPHRAEERLPRSGRDLRARRGRPDARHGLHPGHQADHGAAAPREKRQNLLFSATFSGEIKKLADQLLNAPAADRSREAQHRRGDGHAVRLQGSAPRRSARCSRISSARAT